MGDAESRLAELSPYLGQLRQAQRKLRKMRVSNAFNGHRRTSRKELECWLLIEELLEGIEVVVDILGPYLPPED